jgi:hypothetical protein
MAFGALRQSGGLKSSKLVFAKTTVMNLQKERRTGKISTRDTAVARLLKTAPWVTVLAAALPPPILFFVLFLTTQATDSAAVYLFLAGLSFAFGLAIGLILAAALLLYRRYWLAKLRDRLALDGITASEVAWFRTELTSAERASLAEIERTNPLLADAYLETLAMRLTASRIISRSRKELLKVERRLNQARTLPGKESAALQTDLAVDREKIDQLHEQAKQHLASAKTRLQVIEATASRKLNQEEIDTMMQRLGQAEDQLPLVLQMARMEREALEEVTGKSNVSAE